MKDSFQSIRLLTTNTSSICGSQGFWESLSIFIFLVESGVGLPAPLRRSCTSTLGLPNFESSRIRRNVSPATFARQCVTKGSMS